MIWKAIQTLIVFLILIALYYVASMFIAGILLNVIMAVLILLGIGWVAKAFELI